MSQEILTIQKQFLTDSSLYCIFTYQNDVENFMGIAQFANSNDGHNLHLEFVDWALDEGLYLGQGTLDLWLDTARSTFDDYLLYYRILELFLFHYHQKS